MEEKAWDGGLFAKMGRYSDKATCCITENTQSDTRSYNSKLIIFSQHGNYLEIKENEKSAWQMNVYAFISARNKVTL